MTTIGSIFIFKESILASKGKFNFDHPDAFDNELMEQCLKDIIGGRPTKVNKLNNRILTFLILKIDNFQLHISAYQN